MNRTDIVGAGCENSDFGYRFEVMLADCTEVAAEAQDFELAACDFLRNVIEAVFEKDNRKSILAEAIKSCNMIIENARLEMGLVSAIA